MLKLKTLFLALLLLTASLCAYAQDAVQPARSTPVSIEWPLRDNDVWVMVGDSITEQKLYTSYMEAFVRARYPKLKFAAVNSGKSGQVYIQGIIRFRDTIAAYKPTLITVNFGMNDHVKVFGGADFQDDPTNAPQRFIKLGQEKGARVIVFSASPLAAPADFGQSVESLLNPTDPKKARDRSNPVGRLFADKLRIVAERNNAPFLDQMAPLQTIWGANYLRDRVAAMRQALVPVLDTPIEGDTWRERAVMFDNAVKPFLRSESLMQVLPVPDKENLIAQWQTPKSDATKWEAFRQYMKGWAALVDAANPPFVQVSGYTSSTRPTDLIHPNQAGQLHMAGVLLKLMGADGLVSNVVIDAGTKKLVKAEKATVSDVAMNNGVLQFKRLDESLPFPVDPLARPALGMDVSTPVGTPKDLFGLSRYLLTVTNMPKGNYDLAIDGETVATVSADELARGFDAGLLDKGPIYTQTQKLLRTVRMSVVDALKATPEQVAAVAPTVLPEAQPQAHLWTLTPVK